jgi:hypothetical protein
MSARAAVTRAIASAMRGDEKSRALGFTDAADGIGWHCPAGADVLAYSLGYQEGEQARPRHAERAQREWSQ